MWSKTGDPPGRKGENRCRLIRCRYSLFVERVEQNKGLFWPLDSNQIPSLLMTVKNRFYHKETVIVRNFCYWKLNKLKQGTRLWVWLSRKVLYRERSELIFESSGNLSVKKSEKQDSVKEVDFCNRPTIDLVIFQKLFSGPSVWVWTICSLFQLRRLYVSRS